MQERHEDLETPEGIMPTFVVHPDGDGPFPVILFYMDAPAIREELYDMARQMAERGYFVVLPDLFYRFGILRFPVRGPKSRAIWRECMANMSNAEVMEDTQAMLEQVDSDPRARGGKLACIGFCMSGRLVVTAAGNGRLSATKFFLVGSEDGRIPKSEQTTPDNAPDEVRAPPPPP